MATITDPARPETHDALAKLAAVLGDEHVLLEPEVLQWYAADFTDTEVALPIAVVQPATTEEVVEVVRLAAAAGLSLAPRGGGMSYTLAHTPANTRTVVVDLRRLDRIVEMNLDDRYVTVEAGVTWAQLIEALRGTGYWLTYNGTLSGLHATVGGTLSQNSVGLGRGWLSEVVLGLEVVLGDGRVLVAGSAAAEGASPYHRHFGPDLCGLFLTDSGAFGFKTRATLRLDPVPGGTAFGCFSFDDARSLVAAEVEIARTGLASECLGADSFMNKVMAEMPPPPREEAMKVVKSFLAASSSKPRALRTLARMARPGGMKFMAKVPFSLAVVTDAADQAAADRNLARLRRIAKRHGGTSLPPTFTLGLRYAPFQPIHPLMIGKHGEAGFPSNALVPAVTRVPRGRGSRPLHGRQRPDDARARHLRGPQLPRLRARVRHRTDHLLARPAEPLSGELGGTGTAGGVRRRPRQRRRARGRARPAPPDDRDVPRHRRAAPPTRQGVPLP